jgi:hypothetical protein
MSECRQVRAAVEMAARRDELAASVIKHLSACAPCNVYATETFSVMGLLVSQPRVEAPADFDFRLRARIARARDEQQTVGNRFKALWTRTFSLQRAAAMLALLAFGVTSTTIYLSRPTDPQPGSQVVKGPISTGAGMPEKVATPEIPRLAEARLVSPAPGSADAKIMVARVGRSAVIRPVRFTPAVEHRENRAPSMAMDNTQEVLIYRPGSTQMVNVPRGQVVWGAQLVGLRQSAATRPATQPQVETF